jgi:hypothetical protein
MLFSNRVYWWLFVFSMATMPAAADFSGATFSKLSPEERALLKEYQESYTRLKGFYENSTIEAREEYFDIPQSHDGVFPPPPNAKMVLSEMRDMIFRGNSGQYYRLDVTDYDDMVDLSKKTDVVGIIAPTEGYLLGKNLSTDKYYVKAYGKNRDEYLGILSVFWFRTAPFSCQSIQLEYWLLRDKKKFTIDKIDVKQESGEEIAVIHLSINGNNGWVRTTFQFYRNRSWALKSLEEEAANTGDKEWDVARQQCIYEGEKDGFPLLKECSREGGVKDPSTGKERILHRQVYKIAKMIPGAVNLSYYDADSLLGKIVGVHSTNIWFRVLCVLLGVVLLFIGVLLRRRMVNIRNPIKGVK